MDLSIEKVSMAVLGVIVIAVVFAVFSGALDQTISDFMNSIRFPSVG